jgi:cyclic-di-GMP-binding protein
VWQIQDSNLGRHKPTDLQSVPIGRSGNLPAPGTPPFGGAWGGRKNSKAAPQTRNRQEGSQMADSSFDIVSKIDRQEVDNALGQAAREVATRFDFKGTGASIEWQGEHAIEISASADDRASAVLDVFKDKLVKRQQSLKILDASEPRQSGQVSKISIALKEGITSEDAKKITKLIRDEGPKGVKAQIQGEELRVSSKKRDDLQAIQALVKGQDYDFAVQFTNYR